VKELQGRIECLDWLRVFAIGSPHSALRKWLRAWPGYRGQYFLSPKRLSYSAHSAPPWHAERGQLGKFLVSSIGSICHATQIGGSPRPETYVAALLTSPDSLDLGWDLGLVFCGPSRSSSGSTSGSPPQSHFLFHLLGARRHSRVRAASDVDIRATGHSGRPHFDDMPGVATAASAAVCSNRALIVARILFASGRGGYAAANSGA
jgi:hypothetical protein